MLHKQSVYMPTISVMLPVAIFKIYRWNLVKFVYMGFTVIKVPVNNGSVHTTGLHIAYCPTILGK